MATTAELETALVNADKAGDADAARQLAAAIGHARAAGQDTYLPPMPKLGFVGSVKEAVTGDLRQTDTTNALPDWVAMPEMQSVSVAGLKAALGTMASNPKETAQIMKANFPNIQVTQDEKGNYLFTSAQDGKQYALKPGFQVSDIPRAIGQVLAFTPASRAETLIGAGVKAGLTQTGIEATQAATGGTFDPKEVAVAAATGPLAPLIGNAVVAAKPMLRRATDAVLGRTAAEAPEATTAAANAAPSPAAPVETPIVPPASAAATVAPETAAATANKVVDEAGKPLTLYHGTTANFNEFDPTLRGTKHGADSAKEGYFFTDDPSVAKQYAGNEPNSHVKEVQLDMKNPKIEDFNSPDYKVGTRSTAERIQQAKKEGYDGLITKNIYDGTSLENAKVQNSYVVFDPKQIKTIGAKTTDEAAAVPAEAAVEAAPSMSATDLAATTKKAAEGGFGSNKATQILAEQAAPDAKTVEAAKRLGIEDYLQPDHVTTNQAYRELAQAVKSVPGSAARSQELEGLQAVSKRADDLISEIGGEHDLSQLNAGVKASLQETQTKLENTANALYKQLREGIPQTSPAPAPSVLKFIEQRAQDLGGADNLTPVEKMIQAKLAPKEIAVPKPTVPKNGRMSAADFKAMNEAPKTQIKQPTYALLDDVRRDLTAARIKGQGPFKDADTGLIKKLEMELKTDQRAAIEPHGMLPTFDAAQAAVRTRKALEDDMVSLFGKTLDRSIVGNLGTAVKSLPSGDSTKLINFLKLIPESQRQEVVASGLLTAFGKSARNGNINFGTYAKWYEGLLRNKKAYAAVMSNLPAPARKQLSDLYRISKGISAATKERITTGRIQAVTEELKGSDTLISNIYGVAKRAAVGVPLEAVTSAVGLPGAGMASAVASALTKGKPNAMKAADALIASPEFAEAVKKAATGETKAAAAKLAYSQPFKKFVRALNQPKEMNNREKWIMQALEANNQTKSN